VDVIEKIDIAGVANPADWAGRAFLWETTWSAASTGASAVKAALCLASSIADSTEDPRHFEAITDVHDVFMTSQASA